MKNKLRIALLAPHIFVHQKVLDKTVFAPASLLMDLVNSLAKNHTVTLFTPGPIKTRAKNICANLKLLETEAKQFNCTFPKLIKHKPLTFITLARQAACEIISKAYGMANEGEFDIVHVFTLEEEIALYFANFVNVPVVFTHHDPYNTYARYRARFPNIKNLSYISISNAQRKTAPRGTNFIATVYNGIDFKHFKFKANPENYFAHFGRIVKNKGCHIAISACLKSDNNLKIAGKHYQGHGNENYWNKYIKQHINKKGISYEGFIKEQKAKCEFLGNAKSLLFPILWEEPFGLVIIEANACGTPVIAFNRGSVPEIIKDGVNGFVVKDEAEMIKAMASIEKIDRKKCREYVEKNFSLEKMVKGYERVYKKILPGR